MPANHWNELTRRQFLGGAIAAGALAAGCAHGTRKSASMENTKPILVRDDDLCARNSAAIDDRVRALAAEKRLPLLTICHVHGNRVVYEFMEGSEDPAKPGERGVERDSRLDAGSVSKPVTAMVLIAVMEEHGMTPDDPVQRFIPGYKYPDHTLRHLFTHSAGYDPTAGPPWPMKASDIPGFRELLYQVETARPPGEQSLYWSNGYHTLMQVAETVAGEPIEDIARRVLFDPLGMGHTTYDYRKVPDGKRLFAWNADSGELFTQVAEAPPLGETGLLTNAWDLVRIGQVFERGGEVNGRQLYSPRALEWILADQTTGRFNKSLAFWFAPPDNPRPFGMSPTHSDNAVGHTAYTGCMVCYDPGRHETTAIVTNQIGLNSDYSNYSHFHDLLHTLETTS